MGLDYTSNFAHLWEICSSRAILFDTINIMPLSKIDCSSTYIDNLHKNSIMSFKRNIVNESVLQVTLSRIYERFELGSFDILSFSQISVHASQLLSKMSSAPTSYSPFASEIRQNSVQAMRCFFPIPYHISRADRISTVARLSTQAKKKVTISS